MQKGFLLFIAMVAWAAGGQCLADGPNGVGGFRLGAHVDQYAASLQMETALPQRHMPSVSEVEMKPFEGFRNGQLFFGNCHQPGKVVRIKLRYERDDREFFDELLERFTRKFGKPTEYKGDVFRTFLAWKWSFTDKDKSTISLILQHNAEDDETYTGGNSVKLANTTWIQQERECHEKKRLEAKQSPAEAEKESAREPSNFKLFVPE